MPASVAASFQPVSSLPSRVIPSGNLSIAKSSAHAAEYPESANVTFSPTYAFLVSAGVTIVTRPLFIVTVHVMLFKFLMT